jgi:hypothetical protein
VKVLRNWGPALEENSYAPSPRRWLPHSSIASLSSSYRAIASTCLPVPLILNPPLGVGLGFEPLAG